MKLTLGVTNLDEEVLQFAAQLGVTHLKVNAGDFMDERQRGPVHRDKLLGAKRQIEAHGLQIGVALLPQAAGSQHWNVRLGRPEREREIEDVCRSIETLGREGVPTVEYVFNLAAVWGSDWLPTGRGGAVVRHFDYDRARSAPAEPAWEATEAEVWSRITYFLQHVVPVAESASVKLACHHDDPPVLWLRGETRVLGSLEGIERFLDLVPSPSHGLAFCQGTIAEMGADVIEAIRRFGSRDKIHHVHFRNVKGALPHFQESFIDDGEVDMLEALRAYVEVGYRGTIMPDHTPQVVGDTAWGARGRAYALGYIRALMKALGVLEE